MKPSIASRGTTPSLEVQDSLQTQVLPSNVASVVISFTGGHLSSAHTQTITSSQNTAQMVVSSLNAGTYNVTATLKDSRSATFLSMRVAKDWHLPTPQL